MNEGGNNVRKPTIFEIDRDENSIIYFVAFITVFVFIKEYNSVRVKKRKHTNRLIIYNLRTPKYLLLVIVNKNRKLN